MRRTLMLAVSAILLATAPAAPARDAPRPWATVNVCDTAEHPNQIGIRGAMPGLPRFSRMAMRFRVQYRNAEGKWRTLKNGADSGWVNVAAGRRGIRDAGYTFEFRPPAAGGAYVLRGLVAFEWRRHGRVVRRERRVTEAGHPGTAGAEPEDFSAATCAIA